MHGRAQSTYKHSLCELAHSIIIVILSHSIIIVIIIISFYLDQEIEAGGAKLLDGKRAGSGVEPRTLTTALAILPQCLRRGMGVLEVSSLSRRG